MLAYQVTIRLDKAIERDYAALGDVMLKHGFFRTARNGDGHWFQLPASEFSYFSAFDLSPVVVRDKVVRIAAGTGKRCSVTVVKLTAAARSVYAPPPDREICVL